MQERSGDIEAFYELFDMLERIFHRPINTQEILK